MKILVVGDFHGKFPSFIPKIIKKEKIDLVISLGDYPPFHYRKLWFKHCYGTDKQLWQFIGRKKYKEFILEDLRRAEIPLKGLNELSVTVFTILGNIDYSSADDISDFESSDNESKKNNMPSYDKKDSLVNRLKKYRNIKRFDYSFAKLKNYIFIGMRGHSIPGYVRSKAFKKHKLKLQKIFKKFKNEKIIFVSHNIAHNTKLDKLSLKSIEFAFKNAGKKQKKKLKEREKHYGSKLARRIINSYQPLLHFGGHIHESKGKDKIGKTICVNPGAINEGNYSIIDIDDKKGNVKSVKFFGKKSKS